MSRSRLLFAAGAVALVALTTLAYFGGRWYVTRGTPGASGESVPELSAAEFYDDYAKRPAAVCEKYLGKVVRLTGIVSNGSESGETADLASNRTDLANLDTVHVKFVADQAPAVRSLQRGQRVTLEGEFTGGDSYLKHLYVNNARLVK